jgi:hypothetical protein
MRTRPTAISEEAMFHPVVPKANPDQNRGRWYHVQVRDSGGVGLRSLLIQRVEGESAASVLTSSLKALGDLKALVKVFACSMSRSSAATRSIEVVENNKAEATTRQL